ncbi:hypothetical protein [Desulfonema magnum]|uniref:Uncharacterized protein n=1 Tax=Desulfonema magnum TaxID=45655 RepID=A0A975BXL2_9BACT|nr:hypothetical protein [Desulfonema magnum]QTA93168.1 Uncharacterized protein dnm_092650 [Desulfonema magnum]
MKIVCDHCGKNVSDHQELTEWEEQTEMPVCGRCLRGLNQGEDWGENDLPPDMQGKDRCRRCGGELSSENIFYHKSRTKKYVCAPCREELSAVRNKVFQTANTSGQGNAAIVPPEIRKWNWGAFFLSWIWGLGNRTNIALLCLVPLVNIPMRFVLGVKGNEWAWRNVKWDSVEHLLRVQKKWAIWGT